MNIFKSMKNVLVLLMAITCFLGLTACDALPTENCQHEWSEWHVVEQPTCTKDGYEGRACTLCGETNTMLLPALGHTEVKDEAVSPTCSENGHTESSHCSVCGETIKKAIEIPALGHVGGEATCTQKAICDDCGEEYGELTEHEYSEATCTKKATCVNCGHETGDVAGHTGGKATCTQKAICDVCGEEYGEFAEHEYSEATCTKKATCVNCGHETGEFADHNYSEATCLKKATCVNCGHETGEFADHNYSEATCTKKATCIVCGVETGELGEHTYGKFISNNDGTHSRVCIHDESHVETFKCHGGEATCQKQAICDDCNGKYGETLPHNYVDARCTSCGRTIDCNHDIDTTNYLNLFDNCCGGVINYKSCACGEKKEIINDLSYNYCSFSLLSQTNSTMVYQCGCGLRLEIDYEYDSDNDYYIYDITFIGWDKVRHENFIYIYECQHNNEYIEYINIKGNCCYNYLRECKCKKCDEIIEVTERSNCDFILQNSETKTDETGIEYITNSYKCSVCGLEKTFVETTNNLGNCVVEKTYQYTFKLGEETLQEYSYSKVIDLHKQYDSYEYSFETVGEFCWEGVKGERTCKYCKETQQFYYRDCHIAIEETLFENNTDSCNCKFVKKSCACGQQVFIERQTDCSFKRYTEQYVDENNNIHLIEIEECVNSGLKYCKDHFVGEKNCYIEEKIIYYIEYNSEKTIILEQIGAVLENHDCTYEYEFLGTSCEDGVKVKYSCSKCGMVNEYTIHYHECLEKELIDLTKHGVCFGYLEVYSCPDKKEQYVYNYYLCDFNEISYNIIDEEGNEHYYNVRKCKNCGFEIINDRKYINNDCQRTAYDKIIYKINDKIIFESSYVEQYTEEYHDLETTYILTGTNCNDGYECVKKCKNCDYETKETARSHKRSDTNIVIFNEGLCIGHIIQKECPCKLSAYVSTNLSCNFELVSEEIDENGKPVITEKCSICGLVKVTSQKTEKMNCYNVDYYNITYLYDNEIIFEGKQIYNYNKSHDFETTVEYKSGHNDCTHGVIITNTCKDCGETSIEEKSHHQLNYNEDPQKFVIGEKELIIREGCCVCEKRCSVSYNIDDNSTYEYKDEVVDDVHHSYTIRTYDCGLIIIRDSYYVEEGCYIYEINDYTFKYNDEVIYTTTSKYPNPSHNNEYSFELKGTTCEEGYTGTATCKDCGYVETLAGSYHDIYEIERYEFDDFGGCGGYVYIQECPCKQYQHLYVNRECENTEYNNYTEIIGDIEYIIETTTCNDCGLEHTRMYYTETEGCFNTQYCIVTVKINDQVLIDNYKYVSSSYYTHDYEYSFELKGTTCEEGYTGTATCKDCGNVETLAGSYHNTYEIEKYEFDDFGGCGGYVCIQECPCKQHQRLYVNRECGNVEYDNYAEVVGDIEYGIEITTCKDCGLEHTRMYYTETEGCFNTQYCIVTVKINDQVLIDNYKYRYTTYYTHNNEYSFELKGTTCEEGYTGTATCKDCGNVETLAGSYHNTYVIETIDFNEFELGDSYIKYYSCPCHQEGYYDKYFNFEYDNRIETEYIDGVKHDYYIVTPYNQSFKYIEDRYFVKEGCYKTQYVIITILKGEEVVFEKEYKLSKAIDHDYDISVVFATEEKDCEQGYNITFTCKDCGYTYEEDRKYHDMVISEEFILDNETTCGGYVSYSTCPCGKHSEVNLSQKCENMRSKYENIDIDGVSHAIRTYECPDCGFKYTEDSYITREGCQDVYIYIYNVYLNDQIIFENVARKGYGNTYHEYVYEYQMKGETCQDGVYITESCANCDHYNQYYTESHNWAKYNVVTLNDGVCEGTVELFECACGLNRKLECLTSCNFNYAYTTEIDEATGIIYNVTTRTCSACGLEYITKNCIEKIGCIEYKYSIVTVKHNDKVYVENYKYCNNQYDCHIYECQYIFNNGINCDDGCSVIATCKVCGEVTRQSSSGCIPLMTNYIDLKEYNCCYGSLKIYECGCGKGNYIQNNTSCTMEHVSSTTETIDGIEYTINTYKCSVCGLEKIESRYYELDGCYNRIYNLLTYKIGDTIIIDSFKNHQGYIEQHNYDITIEEFDGVSCENGYWEVRTCSTCGKTYQEYYESHRLYENEKILLDDHNACGGSIVINMCPCGKESNIITSFACANRDYQTTYETVDGIEYEINTQTCADCGLEYIRMYYIETEGCFNTRYCIVTVKINDQVLIDNYKYLYNTYYTHDYEYSFELKGTTCEEGYTGTATCKDCGYVVTLEETYHNTYEIERYEFDDFGGCGGYVYIQECPCKQYQHLYVNRECENTEYDSYTEVIGDVEYSIEITTCKDCGLEHTRMYYTETEGCFNTQYCIVTVKINDQVLIDNYKYLYNTYYTHDMESQYELLGESCEDGWNIINTCKVCGEIEQYMNSYHSVQFTEEITLPEGTCGGTVYSYHCLCGKEGYFTHQLNCDFLCEETREVIDGVPQIKYVYTCQKCGLVYESISKRINDNNECKTYYGVESIKVTYNNEVIYNKELITNKNTYHNYTYKIINGSASEGGQYERVCSCGTTETYWFSPYSAFASEFVDLGDYGFPGYQFTIHYCPNDENIINPDIYFDWFLNGYTYDEIEGTTEGEIQCICTFINTDLKITITKVNQEGLYYAGKVVVTNNDEVIFEK